MAKQGTSTKEAAAALGVSTKWIRARIAEGAIAPSRAGGKRSGYVLSDADIETLRALHAVKTAAAEPAGLPELAPEDGNVPSNAVLARVSRLEADRANLLAQVAWERAIAQEQQKTLEVERARADRLADELDSQRTRIEQLKALSAWDHVRGRHKSI
ncbi:MAG: hypothetical protein U1E26_01110 [Coriobacteriia bacterium]|nr:hypothetical protein [Coriobacteriia bacterium]